MQQPWKSADATDLVRQMGRNPALDLSYSLHFRERLAERDLAMSDVLYILKNGFIYAEPETATQPKLFKYSMETRTPNSGNRIVRIIIIPDPKNCWIKIVTVMWADE